ncbi:MAG: MBL fold metallo-hydrolase [Promethearchaeota archaeon]
MAEQIKIKDIIYFNNKIPVYKEDFTETQRHYTRQYKDIMNLIKENNIKTKDVFEALDIYFNHPEIFKREKITIEKIIFCEKSKIIVLRMARSQFTYKYVKDLARKTGWYFYITGIEIKPSEISIERDKIAQRYSLSNFKLEVNFKEDITPPTLKILVAESNSNSFLLRIGDKNILIEAAFSENVLNHVINRYKNKIDLIFISHSHHDHARNILNIVQSFPDTPIILSNTTLDFLLYRTSKNKKIEELAKSGRFQFTDLQKKLIENALLIKNGDKLPIVPICSKESSISANIGNINKEGNEQLNSEENDDLKDTIKQPLDKSAQNSDMEINTLVATENYLAFYFAGHMPGAMMLFLQFNHIKFLYTGDFTYESYKLIPGVDSVINSVPSPIDYILIDGAFAHQVFDSFNEQMKYLKSIVRFKSEHRNTVLIGADPSSSAIIFYITLHSYFIHLKEDKGFEKRPVFYLSRNIYEYVRILTYRLDDLHPSLRKRIENRFNPFCSALIRWIHNFKDVNKLVKQIYFRRFPIVIIFDLPDLRNPLMREILIATGADRRNSIYLAARMNSPQAIDLVSGQNRITFDGKNKIVFVNEAMVHNRLNPNSIFILHPDETQILQLINKLQPKNVIFFHGNPKLLADIRNSVNNLKFVKETYFAWKNQKYVLFSK